MELVQLIKMCLNEIYSRVRVAKHLSERLLIINGVKKRRRFIAIVFQLHLTVCDLECSGQPRWFEIKWYTSDSGLC